MATATEQPPASTIDKSGEFGSMSSWMKGIEALTADPPPENKEPDGKVTSTERPGVAAPAVKPAVGSPAPVQVPSKVADGTGGADSGGAGTKPADKPAAAPVAEPKEDWETAPKPKGVPEADFKAWKEGRKKAETAFREQITQKDAQIHTLQTQVKEFESKVPNGDLPESTKAELEQLRTDLKDRESRLAVLDVTQHPKFQSHYGGLIDDAIGEAKTLVGADKAEQIEKILKQPESEYKKTQLSDFLTELESDDDRDELRAIVRDMKKVERERDSEIKKATYNREKLRAEQSAKQQQTQKSQQDAFSQTLNALQDPKSGFFMFQFKEGDTAWNEAVTKRIEAAKGLLFGNVKPDVVAQAAMYAVALPTVHQYWSGQEAKWKEEKDGYEAKIAELVKAQPTAGGGSSHDNGTAQPIKKGEKPEKVMDSWMAGVREKLGA